MVINDNKLLDQLCRENDELSEYDELDLSNQHILDILVKVKKISISFSSKDDLGSIENTIKQLCVLIDKCPNLEFIRVFSLSPDSKKLNVNNLIDILVSHSINRIVMSGFNYEYLSLYSKLLSSNNETIVTLDRINDPMSGFTYIFGKEELRKKLQFNSHGNEELNTLYEELRYGSISLKNYEKYKGYLANYKDLYISIGNVNDLDLNKLESIKSDSHVKGIRIKCGYSKDKNAQYYSIEEYENIRIVIDNIIRMIKLPKVDDPNRDKLIFAQIYKILGKNISYDHYAISDEGKREEGLSCNCRNLKNGLLGVNRNDKRELLTVCAGYATILQNICACFNIKCDYISSSSKEIETPGVTIIRGPRKYENGTNDPMGHGYNAIYLDGKAYLCDLTWDADLMKLDKLGQHFLKSYEEFYKSHKDEGFSSENVTIVTQDGKIQRSLNKDLFVHSCPYEEQIQLFGIAAKENIDEMISEGYLANFAMRNIEYIKQVKGKVGMLEYIKLIQIIHGLEEYIKSSVFKSRAGWAAQGIDNEITDENGNVIGKKNFVFYPGARDLSPSDAVDEVISMEEKQWKMR